MRTSLLVILLYYTSHVYSDTCTKTSPCPNGACCSQWGNCGYGPDFCGTGCASNCNAKSECGQYGKQKECPLHVCCSQFGFCGTTDDFCSTANKCQNNCGDPPLPTCADDGRPLLGNSINSVLQKHNFYIFYCRSRLLCIVGEISTLPCLPSGKY